MTLYDVFDPVTLAPCANCETKVSHLINGRRCRLCHEYQAKYHVERPARLWQRPPVVWQPFRPEPTPGGEVFCDCGKVPTWALTVPISDRGKATLLLCDTCAALERRLAPGHSWAGG